MTSPTEKIPVYLESVRDLGTGRDSVLQDVVSSMLKPFLPGDISGKNVLLKPNLLKPGDLLCLTSPEIITAAARLLAGLGARITVADSPAFGTAQKALKSMGILPFLEELGGRVCSLGHPVKTRLPCGISIGISRIALEADLVVNIPRLKAHNQMGVTCAVKNFFGTVTGFRKALAHNLYGSDRQLFAAMILEISQLFPRSVHLVDAVTIMHVKGPSGGIPFTLGILGAGTSCIALDTAFYHVMGLRPCNVPLWQAARHKNLPGSKMEDIHFLHKRPTELLPPEPVTMPEVLEPLGFNPFRLVKGRVKSLVKRLS